MACFLHNLGGSVRIQDIQLRLAIMKGLDKSLNLYIYYTGILHFSFLCGICTSGLLNNLPLQVTVLMTIIKIICCSSHGLITERDYIHIPFACLISPLDLSVRKLLFIHHLILYDLHTSSRTWLAF
jgi:hypothetical protein